VSDRITVLAAEHRQKVTSEHAVDNRQRCFVVVVYRTRQTAVIICLILNTENTHHQHACKRQTSWKKSNHIRRW